MSTIETLLKEERQANVFVALAHKDDEQMVEQGYGRYVDLWLTERLCMDGIAAIYGLRGHL